MIYIINRDNAHSMNWPAHCEQCGEFYDELVRLKNMYEHTFDICKKCVDKIMWRNSH